MNTGEFALMDRAEVCKALGGIHPKTLRKLITEHKFPDACTTDGRPMWMAGDVKAYLWLKGRIGRVKAKTDTEGDAE